MTQKHHVYMTKDGRISLAGARARGLHASRLSMLSGSLQTWAHRVVLHASAMHLPNRPVLTVPCSWPVSACKAHADQASAGRAAGLPSSKVANLASAIVDSFKV